MRGSLFIIFPFLASCILFGSNPEEKPGTGKEIKDIVQVNHGFAVLELFTSQGCSSCPPADELLGRIQMEGDENIIPLAFHVDYWNRLGWTDSFSNVEFTDRQHQYQEFLHTESVYTPQLVINGQSEIVGSDESGVRAGIKKAIAVNHENLLIVSDLQVLNGVVTAACRIKDNKKKYFLQAALVQQNAITDIKAGENQGLHHINYSIVREFSSSALKDSLQSVQIHIPAHLDNTVFQLVILLQERSTGKITDVYQTKMK